MAIYKIVNMLSIKVFEFGVILVGLVIRGNREDDIMISINAWISNFEEAFISQD